MPQPPNPKAIRPSCGKQGSRWWGEAKNHPFIDGNKRVALLIAFTFLEVNGCALITAEDEQFDLMVAIATGGSDVNVVEDWMRQHLMVAAVSEETSASAEEVSASTEEMSAQVEEMVAQAQSLAQMAEELQTIVAQFKTRDETRTAEVAMRRRRDDWQEPQRQASKQVKARPALVR